MKNNEIKIIQNLEKKNATRVERYELANLFSSREKWEESSNKIWKKIKIKIIPNLSAVQKE